MYSCAHAQNETHMSKQQYFWQPVQAVLGCDGECLIGARNLKARQRLYGLFQLRFSYNSGLMKDAKQRADTD